MEGEKSRYIMEMEGQSAEQVERMRKAYEVFRKHLGDMIPETKIESSPEGMQVSQEIADSEKLKSLNELNSDEIERYRESTMNQVIELINSKLPAVREELATEIKEDDEIDLIHNIRESRLGANILVNPDNGKIFLAGLFGAEKEKSSSPEEKNAKGIRKIFGSLKDAFSQSGIKEMLSRGRTRLELEVPSDEHDIIAMTYDDFPSVYTPELLQVLDHSEKEYQAKLEKQLDEIEKLQQNPNLDANQINALQKEAQFLTKKLDQGLKATFFMNKANMDELGNEKSLEIIKEVLKRGHYIANHEAANFTGDVSGYYKGHGNLTEMEDILKKIKKNYPDHANQLLPSLVRRSGVHTTKLFEEEKEKRKAVELLAHPVAILLMAPIQKSTPKFISRIAKLCVGDGNVIIWHVGRNTETKIDNKGDFLPQSDKKSDLPPGQDHPAEIQTKACRDFLKWYIEKNGHFAPTTKEYIPELK